MQNGNLSSESLKHPNSYYLRQETETSLRLKTSIFWQNDFPKAIPKVFRVRRAFFSSIHENHKNIYPKHSGVRSEICKVPKNLLLRLFTGRPIKKKPEAHWSKKKPNFFFYAPCQKKKCFLFNRRLSVFFLIGRLTTLVNISVFLSATL